VEGIPTQVGRYRVDRLLGAGAMGFVFLGRDPELDRPVAIKTLKDLGMGPEALECFLERFRNEARAAARLSHTSIVQVFDVGDDPEVGPYLVFEYVAGSTLKQTLTALGPLGPAELMRLADELSGGIDLAHANGIIHRDIKPDNLLVTPDGHTKLADFGVARLSDAALTREGQFLGTPCYAAPETLDRGDVSPRSDLFSLAAVLYESATGVRAFPGTDAVGVAHKVIHDDPPPPSEVAPAGHLPATLDAVLMRGLEKDPARRFGSAREFADAIAGAWPAAAAARRDPTGRVPLPVDEGRGSSGTGAFIAVLLGGLAVGVALIFAFDAESTTEVDAGHIAFGPVDGAMDAAADHDPDASLRSQASEDAGAVVVLDAGPPSARDAGLRPVIDAGALDTGATPPPAATLTPHDREEAAKDALREARVALREGQVAEARRALDRARAFDPENADITELEERLTAQP